MAEKLVGYWKSVRHEGLSDYMKETNVNFILRSVAPRLGVDEEIIKDGDHWKINIYNSFKNMHYEFTIGVPFTEHTIDGKTFTMTVTIEGDKLVAIQEAVKEGDVPAKFTREIDEEGHMLMTYQTLKTKVESRRWFKRGTK